MRGRSVGSDLLRRLAPVLGIAAFLGLWELGVRAFHVESYKLPRPSDVLREVVRNRSTYWSESLPTIREMVVGFVIAFAIAFVVASLVAHSSALERAVIPIAVIVQVTPLYAYGAAIVLWAGFGMRSIVIMVAIVCFPPFLMNAVSGLRDVDPSAVELLSSVEASRWEVFVRLRVPSALPQLFSAAKVAAGLALVGATIGEPWAFVDSGLGVLIRKSAAAGTVGAPQLWGSIFVLGLIGSFAYLAISGTERAALHWHSGTSSRPGRPTP